MDPLQTQQKKFITPKMDFYSICHVLYPTVPHKQESSSLLMVRTACALLLVWSLPISTQPWLGWYSSTWNCYLSDLNLIGINKSFNFFRYAHGLVKTLVKTNLISIDDVVRWVGVFPPRQPEPIPHNRGFRVELVREVGEGNPSCCAWHQHQHWDLISSSNNKSLKWGWFG